MSGQKLQGGGLWNSTRPTISNETQNLLKGEIGKFLLCKHFESLICCCLLSHDARVKIDQFSAAHIEFNSAK